MEVALYLDTQEKKRDGKNPLVFCASIEEKKKEEDNKFEKIIPKEITQAPSILGFQTDKKNEDVTHIILKQSKSNEDDTWFLHGTTIASADNTKLVFDVCTGVKDNNEICLWPENHSVNQKFYFHMDGTIRTEPHDGVSYYIGTENWEVEKGAKLVVHKLTEESPIQKWRLVTIIGKEGKGRRGDKK